MLAQGLAMAGRFDEALQARAENIPLQQTEDWLRRVLPGTYCYLALDSALLGDSERFDTYVERLCEVTQPGDAHQWRYNASAMVRGLVLLGRNREALDWADGRTRICGQSAPASLQDLALCEAIVDSHPEVSTLRALCRACRRVDAPERATAFAERVQPRLTAGADQLAWLEHLVKLELALAQWDLSHFSEAEITIADARGKLAQSHPGATAAYADLMTAPISQLEAALDRVWY